MSNGLKFSSPFTSADQKSDVRVYTEAELRFWIDCLGAPLLVVEKHSPTIRFANTTAEAFFQRNKPDFEQAPLNAVLGMEAEQLLGQVWSSSAIGVVGEPFIIPSHLDGQNRSLIVRATKMSIDAELLRLFTFADAPPVGSVALAGWQDNMMEILNWFPFGFEIGDHADRIQFANAECRRLFGYEQHELESPEDWWRLAYPDPDYRKYAKAKWESELETARNEAREMTPFDLDVTAASGEVRIIQFRHRTIGSFNVNLFVDVTRERRYENELKRIAGTDPLTGAMNRRRFFEDIAEMAVAGTSKTAAALLMLDIDHFKSVNDSYGHGAGDRVLQEVTRRCRQILRGMDKFARFGGEEFAILLPETDLDEAAKFAERLREMICRTPFQVGDAELEITTSVGIATFAGPSLIDTAISRADFALYEAKRRGRNRVVIADATS